jgi:hypothetical protein
MFVKHPGHPLAAHRPNYKKELSDNLYVWNKKLLLGLNSTIISPHFALTRKLNTEHLGMEPFTWRILFKLYFITH